VSAARDYYIGVMSTTKDGPPAARRKSMGMSIANPAMFDAFGRRLKKVQFENTYRMEPKTPFPVDKATEIIKEVTDVDQLPPLGARYGGRLYRLGLVSVSNDSRTNLISLTHCKCQSLL